MRRVFQLTALVLLAVWLPATMHCGLETILGWSTEHCDHHDSTNPGADAEHGVVENGNYRAANTAVAVVAPMILTGRSDLVFPVIAPAAAPGTIGRGESPPELARTWQFVARAALPANAPSHVS